MMQARDGRAAHPWARPLAALGAAGAAALCAAAGLTWARMPGPAAGGASNVPAPQGQTGPQPMISAAPHAPPPANDGATSSDPLVRGAYLARMGDCVACHTAPGGKPYAGGLPMASPIGTLYSTNITPDAKTGIGGYSFEDFDRAVREGVSRGRGSLYPAMPYPSYARLSEQDMRDLYAYFMKGVAPVEHAVPDNDIPWPLSMRWPLAVWRMLFAPDADEVQAKADAVSPQADPKLRGAYLVEGLGHCGSCHTPRAFTMQEKALTDSDPVYLSGGDAPIDGWIAKSLRGEAADGLGRWSEQDIVDLLKTGRNNQTAVFGGMSDVIRHSTQYLSDRDLRAIAVYLKALSPREPGRGDPAYAASPDTANALWKGDARARGAALYLDNCAACHRSDGKGYAQVFPALAGNSAVLAADPRNVIGIVLQGHEVPATATRPSTFTMPAFGWRLTDQQVADIATFVRASWGNQAGAVDSGAVRNVRSGQQEAASSSQ